jgi:hypothetical protein
MAAAEFAEGPEEQDRLLLDAKADLVRDLIDRHPFFAERFQAAKNTDLSKRIELAVTPGSLPVGDGNETDIFYDLSGVLVLDEERLPPEEVRTENEFLVVYEDPRIKKCLIPYDWLLEALDGLDEISRERLATHLTDQKRTQLASSTEITLISHLDALERAYHHILGDDEHHRV